MDKQQFNNKVLEELDYVELQNLNSEIYFNPDHVDYYMRYQAGDYDWCWNYLMKNRNLLKRGAEQVDS